MTRRSSLLASVLVCGAWASSASATTLVTSLAAFQAGAAGLITSTANPGNFDLTQLSLPTTSTIALGDGTTISLPNPAEVTVPQSDFPYLLKDGFAGEIFVPQDASGNFVSSVTISLGGGISALGFEVAPYSSAQPAVYAGVKGGPYSVSVTLANGQSTSVSLPGGIDDPAAADSGTTASQFFGFYGGGVSSLTISTSDPRGLGFGNFVDVPEPASAAVLLVGLAGLARTRRRLRCA